ncbi:hypothetical protein, partial [Hathewaya limosa]
MKKRFLSTLIAAALATNITSMVLASETNNTLIDINQIYKSAYDATTKSLNEKTQVSIKEAREAINKLPKEYGWAISEFSKQIDTVQQPIFVQIIHCIKKAEGTNKQNDINNGRGLVKDVIEEQYRSTWSSVLDKVQQEKINRLVRNVNEVNTENINKLVIIEEELSDLNKVKFNNTVKDFVDTYSDEIFVKITSSTELTNKYCEIIENKLDKKEIEEIKACSDSEELVDTLKNSQADKNKLFNSAIYWVKTTDSVDIEKLSKKVKEYSNDNKEIVKPEKEEVVEKAKQQKEAEQIVRAEKLKQQEIGRQAQLKREQEEKQKQAETERQAR